MTVSMLSSFFIGLTLACLGVVYGGLRQTTTGLADDDRRRLLRGFTGGLTSWALLLMALALGGLFQRFDWVPPALPFFVFAPVVVLILLLRSTVVQRWLRVVPLSYLLGIQSFRFFVELLLWGMAIEGALPERLSFEGWNFDIVIGITAPLMAWGASRQTLPKGLLIGWNLLGIALLAIVASMGFLSMPSPARVFLEDDVRRLAGFPWVWLPTILVALGYYAHCFALWKLWRKPE